VALEQLASMETPVKASAGDHGVILFSILHPILDDYVVGACWGKDWRVAQTHCYVGGKS